VKFLKPVCQMHVVMPASRYINCLEIYGKSMKILHNNVQIFINFELICQNTFQNLGDMHNQSFTDFVIWCILSNHQYFISMDTEKRRAWFFSLYQWSHIFFLKFKIFFLIFKINVINCKIMNMFVKITQFSCQ
jgi:hypothetical protein